MGQEPAMGHDEPRRRSCVLFVLALILVLLLLQVYESTPLLGIQPNKSKRGDSDPSSGATESILNNDVIASLVNKTIASPTPTSWWQSRGMSLAREYKSRSAEYDPFQWCVDKNTSGANGLLFFKINKCASSTGSGISLTIAHNVAMRKRLPRDCLAHVAHRTTQQLPIPARSKQTSLLWTVVRHPATRAISSFFFFKVRRGTIPTDENMRKDLETSKNFQFRSIKRASLKHHSLPQVIQEMDFIAVAERMDESLVVFRLLNGFHDMDMIALSTKKSGSYASMVDPKHRCHRIPPSFTTPAIDTYLLKSFVEGNRDFVLYAAANASLDKTIDALGRELVEKEVKRHQYLQRVADEHCAKEADFPCSDTGERQVELSNKSCFERDWGCGHECVYRLLQHEGL